MKLVSVIMSVYNGEKHVQEAIDSILRQHYAQFEFIIIDDRSTDATPDILQHAEQSDARIKILKNPENIGLTRSLNLGIQASRGEYLARQDADDRSHPDRLQQQVAFLEIHPEVMLLGTSTYFIDEAGNVLGQEFLTSGAINIKRDLMRGNQFRHGSLMMRRKCLTTIGMYREEFKYAQDYDLALRIAESYAIDNLPKFLYYYRISPDAISVKNGKEQQIAAMIARTAIKLQRKGRVTGWSPEVYDNIRNSIDTTFINKRIESNLNLERGRNYLLKGLRKEAQKAFLQAFMAFPTWKRFQRLWKSIWY